VGRGGGKETNRVEEKEKGNLRRIRVVDDKHCSSVERKKKRRGGEAKKKVREKVCQNKLDEGEKKIKKREE